MRIDFPSTIYLIGASKSHDNNLEPGMYWKPLNAPADVSSKIRSPRLALRGIDDQALELSLSNEMSPP